MPSLGSPELIIILVIVLILFGGSRIGELGGALGRGIKEFKASVRDEETPPAGAGEKEKEAKPAGSAPATTTRAAAPTTATAPPPTASAPRAAASAPPPDGANTGATTAGMTEVGAAPAPSGEAPRPPSGETPRRDS